MTTDDLVDAPVLWVVLIHWNAGRAARRTVARLRDQDVPVHIVLVDNDSRPEELALVAPLVDEVLPSGGNVGFGPGANVGLRHWLAQDALDPNLSGWCVVAPHDALPEPGALARLLEVGAQQPQAGLLCGDVGDQASPAVDPYLGPLPGPAQVYAGYEPVTYPHGTLMLVRRTCIEDIGVFDERYFAYNEEADLGLRAGAAGWEVGLVRGELIENPGQGNASAVVDYLMLRNTILLLREHKGVGKAIFRTVFGAIQLVLGLIPGKTRSPWFNARARRLALRDAWTGRFGPPPDDLR